MTITPEEIQQTDFIYETMDPAVRYHTYIQKLEDEPKSHTYYSPRLTITESTRVIPFEKIDTNNFPADPRTLGNSTNTVATEKTAENNETVSEEDSLEVLQSLESMDTSEEEKPTDNQALTAEDIIDITINDWLIIDENGTTTDPEDLIPPEDIDYFDLVEID